MVALLTADSFNRADGALGNTNGAGTLDALAWTLASGNLQIISNGARVASAGESVAVVETSHSNVDVSLDVGTGSNTGIVLRYSDINNFIYLYQLSSGTTLQLVKRVAGSNTVLKSITVSGGAATIRIKAINNVFTIYKAGSVVGRVIDKFNRSATKVGIYADNTTSVDNFSVSSVDVPTELSTDSFDRSNSSLLGNTDGVGTKDPLTWDALSGSSFISDIVSNQAAVGGSATVAINPTGITWSGNLNFIDTLAADTTIHVTVAATSVAIIFRYVDSSNYWMFLTNGTSDTRLYKKVAGSWTNVSGSLTAAAAGDVLTVRTSGSTIICELKGVVLFTTADSDLKTATKVGFSVPTTGTADNFQVWAGDPAVPVINQVGPTQGPTGGGTEVTILGNNFTGATDVKFGSLSATSFTVVSDTYIRATTPAHSAALVHTIVTNADGDNVLEDDDLFTFIVPSPLVSSVTPSHGAPAGGTSVVLTGAYFTGATSVKFGTTEATTFTVDNDGQITATTPAHAAGVTPVIVTTPYGTNG